MAAAAAAAAPAPRLPPALIIKATDIPFPRCVTLKAPKPAKGAWIFGPTEDIRAQFELGKALGQAGHFGSACLAREVKAAAPVVAPASASVSASAAASAAAARPAAAHAAAAAAARGPSDGWDWAVKMIVKSSFPPDSYDQFRREVAIMERLDHPHVISLKAVFEDEAKLFIVMELCKGGELFEQIQKSPYSERDAARILRQIFQAVAYLHAHHVAHCDLKPDNFLFTAPDMKSVKVIDFGLSKFVKRRQYYHSFCGTSFYAAPEVCSHPPKFDDACDLWSMGVVTFVMLFGYPPFHDESDARILALVRKGFAPVVKPGWGAHFPAALPVSRAAMDFVARLMTTDIAKRMTAEEALSHPWLKGDAAGSSMLDPLVLASLRSFVNRPRLKNAVLRLMADTLNEHELEALRKTFVSMDANHDGSITMAELKAAMNSAITADGSSVSAGEIERIMAMADMDGNGSLSLDELQLSVVHHKLIAREERLFVAFRKIDLDGNGTISADEVGRVLRAINPLASDSDIVKMLCEVDANHDGTIDYNEFLGAMWERDEKAAITPGSVVAKRKFPSPINVNASAGAGAGSADVVMADAKCSGGGGGSGSASSVPAAGPSPDPPTPMSAVPCHPVVTIPMTPVPELPAGPVVAAAVRASSHLADPNPAPMRT